MFFFFFFFKQKTAYEMLRSLVGSEMCIRDRHYTQYYCFFLTPRHNHSTHPTNKHNQNTQQKYNTRRHVHKKKKKKNTNMMIVYTCGPITSRPARKGGYQHTTPPPCIHPS
eukprot:TRINITY_DN5367_c0_g1_i3.p2 TRINITY_DN5367_c0_g1~~TRINITY_DN5367_c0_g1_i3.p2  ORF type:complete len:111 (+),score=30.68 TRINITY_DN5367_c0_g1_i3:109-441(+)